jgi:hypothetical protein
VHILGGNQSSKNKKEANSTKIYLLLNLISFKKCNYSHLPFNIAIATGGFE